MTFHQICKINPIQGPPNATQSVVSLPSWTTILTGPLEDFIIIVLSRHFTNPCPPYASKAVRPFQDFYMPIGGGNFTNLGIQSTTLRARPFKDF
jgi:hypothetical protein